MKDINSLFRAAADFTRRKCDTIYYSLATIAFAGWAIAGGDNLNIAINFTAIIASRECVRAATWLTYPDPKVRLGFPVSLITASAAMSLATGLMAIDQTTKVISTDGTTTIVNLSAIVTQLSFAFASGISAISMKTGCDRFGLGVKSIFNLYKNHLFDYYDKINPPKNPRFRDKLKSFAARLLPQPKPVPI